MRVTLNTETNEITDDAGKLLGTLKPVARVFYRNDGTLWSSSGERVFNTITKGTLCGMYDGRRRQASHVVWEIHHGSPPIGVIKYRDNDPMNIRIENLYDTLDFFRSGDEYVRVGDVAIEKRDGFFRVPMRTMRRLVDEGRAVYDEDREVYRHAPG